jgi:hypothetical protein
MGVVDTEEGTPVEPDAAAFSHARQTLRIDGTITLKATGQVQTFRRHYLTSLPADHSSPPSLAQQVRGHWDGRESQPLAS